MLKFNSFLIRDNSSNWSMFGQFFLIILSLIFILILAYFTTRIVGSNKLLSLKNNNIKIIESLSVGFQGSLMIIEVANKMILISVTKDKISFLQELDSENIILRNNTGEKNFSNYFKNYLDKNRIRKDN